MDAEEAGSSDRSSSNGSSAASSSVVKSKRPPYTKFTQQELPACKPLLTTEWVLSIFMTVGIIFIPIGACALSASRGVVEIVDEYEQACIPSATTQQGRIDYIQDSTTNKMCTRVLQVPKHMMHPIYVYYELHNFYQNHRRYVKSRSDSQLWSGSSKDVGSCEPLSEINGQTVVPCGLVAWSLFNDTYAFQVNGQPLSVDRQGIAWKSDRDSKFGKNVFPSNFPNNIPNGSWIGGASLDTSKPLSDNEDLMVWMRTAALPNFRKLWGRIDQNLYAGDTITVDISNLYNVYSFNGKKLLVLSTSSWLGGKNDFLGIAYLVVGSLSMALALLFFALHLKSPRPLGDTSYLSWNQKPVMVSTTASSTPAGSEAEAPSRRPMGRSLTSRPLERVLTAHETISSG